MTEARWARISEVFGRAVEMTSGPERDSWLSRVCGTDETLRRNVQRLLDANAQPSLPSPIEDWGQIVIELEPGDEIVHYRVEAKIGQGGMGVVYRAFDTKLHRPVALKVLPLLYATSDDRKQRLLREARTASALNHPNIVTIHEVGSDEDFDFIAMEYVDGVPLDDEIGENGMPVSRLVSLGLQIADALGAAHEARVLHRDVKPSNIMVTRDDRIKVLDFGIARLLESGEAGATRNQTLTGQGIIRGTPAYMSPEQAGGRDLDTRSDVFSLGCVLYQMATGRRPFEGDSHVAVMYRVENEAPRLPSEILGLPPDLEALILRCLEKDPACRFQSMSDLKLALETLDPAAKPRRTNPASRRLVRRLAISGAAIAILAAGGWMLSRLPRNGGGEAIQRTVKFAITPANLLRGGLGEVDSEVSISRDGKHIAYVESQGGQLWIRDIDSEQARPVPGATEVYQAFWSPDSRWIGYASGQACGIRAGCALAKIAASGGTPERLVTMAGSFKRASWSSDGRTIVYCDSLGMYTVPAGGGAARRIVEHGHIEHPSILELPGGRNAFLYQALDAEQPSHAIYIQVAGESERHLVKVSESTNPYPAWSSTGHVIYVDGPNTAPSIWALPFSLSTLRPTGDPFRIVERGSAPMLSANGTMVYGDPPSSELQLAWADPSGKSISLLDEPRVQSQPVLSRDGRRVAVVTRDSGWDISVYDTVGGTWTALTSDGSMESLGSWGPESDEVTYISYTTREWAIQSNSPGSNTAAREWLRVPYRVWSPEWTPDGRFLMYSVFRRQNKGDLVYRERLGSGALGEELNFTQTPEHEMGPRFSPDGRFVAYVSDETGRPEIFIRDFPGGMNRWRVSKNGGNSPRWRRDGRELYFAEGAKLLAAKIALRPSFKVETPVALFERPALGLLQFDSMPDGRRFLVLGRTGEEKPLAVHVVQNWFEEFRTSK